ncbi:MAG: hypothetical protein KatS3mg109_2046 [Pirellulaceae bacterium]|nr:MAG: hypothetical protein KatS3mg109_2046 [Pirellulaceae bacterium]
MAFLVVQSGPTAGTKSQLTKQETLIGRHPDCDIVIEDSNVSRFHAKIVSSQGRHLIVDLKSRNGTWLNGAPIGAPAFAEPQPHPLEHGDEIRVCGVTFLYMREPTEAFGVGQESSSHFGFQLADDVGAGSTILTKLEIGSSSAVLGASPEAKLAALLEINRALARALALDAVLPKVLESLFRIFVQADRGFIVLKEPNGELVPRWMHTRRAKAGESARISRTIVRQVLQTKEAILSADAASDDRFDMSQSLADFRIRSLMCAPLLSSDGEALGVLQLDTLDQRKRFDQQDLEILAAVAAQAGIAIANAQLHEQILRQRTLERDLQLANQVQRSFLPGTLPEVPGYSFYHYYQAANQVGGDYFDYVPLSEDRLAIVLADVVGHGVAAALLMARLSAETRYCLATESDVGAALAKLNNRFLGPTPDRFITMVAAVLDPHQHLLQIAIAGHMPPLWKRQAGSILDAGEEVADVPIGVAPDIRYATAEIHLAPGDMLLFYTDGISEAMDPSDQCFGISRIHDFLEQTHGTVAQLGEGLIQEVRRFAGSNAQSDDMCIVCLGRQ